MKIEVKDLSVVLSGRSILNGINAIWESGTSTLIMGPNGAGKTTLLNTLSGNLRPVSGAVLFDDIDVTNLAPHRRANAYIRRSFQHPSLPPSMTLRELLAVSQRGWSGGDTGFPSQPADSLMQDHSVRDVIDKQFRELNHSKRKLIEVFSALLSPAPILLLDEPAAGLSPDEKQILFSLLRTEERRTLILVEHDLTVAEELEFQINFMMDGEIVHQGALHETREFAGQRNVYI